MAEITLNPIFESVLRHAEKWLKQQAALTDDVPLKASLMRTSSAIARTLDRPSEAEVAAIKTRLDTNCVEAAACGLPGLVRMLEQQCERVAHGLRL